jgi:ParB-like chromosome segregation protein Spo0J
MSIGGNMNIQKVAIEEINPAKYNPRKDLQPGDEEYEKLKRSIMEFDLVEPLIMNKQGNVLVGGHQRLKILKELGHTETDVSIVDLPPEKEKALNIALNKISGEWDFPLLKDLLEGLDGEIDLELTGFDINEIESLTDKFDIDEIDAPMLADGDRTPYQQMTFTLHDEQAEKVKEALSEARGRGGGESAMNENSNGNALYFICEAFING